MNTPRVDDVDYDDLWWMAPVAWALLGPVIYGLIAFPLIFFAIIFIFIYGAIPAAIAGLIFATAFVPLTKISRRLRQDLSLAGFVAALIGAMASYVSSLLFGAKASQIMCAVVGALLGTLLVYWYGIRARSRSREIEQSDASKPNDQVDNA